MEASSHCKCGDGFFSTVGRALSECSSKLNVHTVHLYNLSKNDPQFASGFHFKGCSELTLIYFKWNEQASLTEGEIR